jgi:hypothetical protein
VTFKEHLTIDIVPVLAYARTKSAESLLIKNADEGIEDNRVFLRSIRHVNFITKAVENKVGNVYGNPFWAYRRDECAPQVGDIVCRAKNGIGINYDSVRRRWTGNSHTDVVVDKDRDETGKLYIIAIGGNLEYDRIYTVWSDSEGKWVNQYTEVVGSHRVGELIPYGTNLPNVSVGKRKIYLRDNGTIDPNAHWEVFNNAVGAGASNRIQFTGPQNEYFAVIRVRTDPSEECSIMP